MVVASHAVDERIDFWHKKARQALLRSGLLRTA
jgi:hypothetical protein